MRSIFSCLITLIFATLIVKIGLDINNDTLTQLLASPAQDSLMTIGATALGLGIIISSLTLVATKIAGNIAGVAATSAIQGGMALATKASTMRAAQTNKVAAVGAAIKAIKYLHHKIQARRADAFKRIQQDNSKSNP